MESKASKSMLIVFDTLQEAWLATKILHQPADPRYFVVFATEFRGFTI
jgi:hypothetical protein